MYKKKSGWRKPCQLIHGNLWVRSINFCKTNLLFVCPCLFPLSPPSPSLCVSSGRLFSGDLRFSITSWHFLLPKATQVPSHHRQSNKYRMPYVENTMCISVTDKGTLKKFSPENLKCRAEVCGRPAKAKSGFTNLDLVKGTLRYASVEIPTFLGCLPQNSGCHLESIHS